MLDIYSVADEDENWDEPQEEFYIGSLSLDEWQVLSGLWPMIKNANAPLSPESFFEDSRVMSSDVAVVLNQIEKIYSFKFAK